MSGRSNKGANAPSPPSDGGGAAPKVRAPLERPRAKGGFTRAEKEALHAGYVAGEPPEVVAARLGRAVETVGRYFDTLAAKGVGLPAGVSPPEKTKREVLLEGLHASPLWKSIREKFGTNEVRLYEDNYAQLLEQFGDDVVVTERMQVDKYLTTIILSDRNLKDQKRVRERMDECRGLISEIVLSAGPDGPAGRPAAQKVALELELEGLREEQAELSKGYRDLEQSNGKMLEQMKATRNQRLERIEGRSKSILDLVKELMAEDKRVAEGLHAERFRQAALKKAAELAVPHRFADGSVDPPLLTPDTVGGAEDAPAPG